MGCNQNVRKRFCYHMQHNASYSLYLQHVHQCLFFSSLVPLDLFLDLKFFSIIKSFKLSLFNFYLTNSFEIYSDGIVGYGESKYKISSHSEKFYIFLKLLNFT